MKKSIFFKKVLLLYLFVSLVSFAIPTGLVKTAEANTSGSGATSLGCNIDNFTLSPSLMLSWVLSPQCTSYTVSSPVTGAISATSGGGPSVVGIAGMANEVAQTNSTVYTITASDSANNTTTKTWNYTGAQHDGCVILGYGITGSGPSYSISVNGTGHFGCTTLSFDGTVVANLNTTGAQNWGGTWNYTMNGCSTSAEPAIVATDSRGLGTIVWVSVTPTCGGSVPVVTLTPSAGNISSGASVDLTWTATNNPTLCTPSANPINANWKGAGTISAAGGTKTIPGLTQTTDFSLFCQNGSGASAIVTKTVTVGNVNNPPDLTASSPTPTTATVNVAQTFSSTITNQGIGSTITGFTNLFQTSPVSDGSSGVTDYPVSGMAALSSTSGSNTATTSKSITFGSAGTYYIRACADKSSAADANGNIAESNELNNCSSPWTAVIVTGGSPLTTPTGLSATTSGSCGGYINISWNSVSGATGYNLYRDGSGTPMYSGSSTSYSSDGPFSVGTSHTYKVSATNPADNPPESGLSTSVSGTASSTCVGSFPDLVAATPPQTAATVGVAQTFTSVITNQGNASTGASFTNLFQTSTSSDGTANLNSYPVSGMAALSSTSGSNTATTSKSITFSSAGTYYIRACADKSSAADANGVIPESDENNNCSNGTPWSAVVVGLSNKADLTAGAPYLPSAPPSVAIVNTAVTFTSSITNGGTASTVSSFNNLFNVATADGGGGNVSVLSDNSRPTLAAGISGNVTSSSYTFTTPGIYSVQTCADQDSSGRGTISESNEANNCSTWTTVTVLGAQQPYAEIDASPKSVSSGGSSTVSWRSWNASTCVGQSNPGNASWMSATRNVPNSNGVWKNVSVTSITQTTSFWVQCSSKDSSTDNKPYPTVTVTVAGTDLTADSATPSTATTGVALTFSSLIKNIGSVSTGASFKNFFQIATAANGGGTIADQTFSTMPTLAGGGFATATSPSHTFASAGTYSVRACADKSNSADTGTITETDETNNCGAWENVTVSDPVTSGTISATSCVILRGASTCKSSATWNTVNPVGTSIVTNSAGSTVATANSGSAVQLVVKYSSDTFFLKNNGTQLALANVFSTCAAGNSWDGSKCSPNGPGGNGGNTCANGASNWPLCTGNITDTCLNGASNYPVCSVDVNNNCLNGAGNPPDCTCTDDTCIACLNGAANPPLCTIDINNKCLDGATNPPTCYNKAPIYKEN